MSALSTSYLTKLEQGTETNPSRAALERIMDAIELKPVEHVYMTDLAAAPIDAPLVDDAPLPVIDGKLRAYADTLNPHLAAYHDSMGRVAYENTETTRFLLVSGRPATR